jgi:hypothetical protein
MVIGESGSGKTTSLRNLDPLKTFIIGTISKPFPFKTNKYNLLTKENKGGNLYFTDDADLIVRLLETISTERKDINTVVIDDFQYMLSNEFMRRSGEKGFDKFTDIGKNCWKVANACRFMRDDINVYVLSHSNTDENGKTKCKTIGKLIDDKVCLEGLFTIVLNALIVDNKYLFLTQNNGQSIAKSPMGMFDLVIDNDLNAVNQKINDYYNQDIKQ